MHIMFPFLCHNLLSLPFFTIDIPKVWYFAVQKYATAVYVRMFSVKLFGFYVRFDDIVVLYDKVHFVYVLSWQFTKNYRRNEVRGKAVVT